MKKFASLFLLLAFLTSCSSVRVTTDYDTSTNFSNYKTFAFYKKGIDKAKISDLDKRRILKAIETEMLSKGFKKSNNPDLLVSIYAKSRKKVNVDRVYTYPRNYWYPRYYFDNDRIRVTKHIEGTLFIDFIDKKAEKLVWQGIGSGMLGANTAHKKEEKINLFVKDIISKYPPEEKK